MSQNPYSSSLADPSQEMRVAAGEHDRALLRIARLTFLAWEKLRLVYIVVLGAITILLLLPNDIFDIHRWVLVMEGAVIANLAYFAGPILETYIRWLGYDRQWPRWVLFVGGILLSMALAAASLASGALPNQN